MATKVATTGERTCVVISFMCWRVLCLSWKGQCEFRELSLFLTHAGPCSSYKEIFCRPGLGWWTLSESRSWYSSIIFKQLVSILCIYVSWDARDSKACVNSPYQWIARCTIPCYWHIAQHPLWVQLSVQCPNMQVSYCPAPAVGAAICAVPNVRRSLSHWDETCI